MRYGKYNKKDTCEQFDAGNHYGNGYIFMQFAVVTWTEKSQVGETANKKIEMSDKMEKTVSKSAQKGLTVENETQNDISEEQIPNRNAIGNKPMECDDYPKFVGDAYVVINNNMPYFEETDKILTEPFEHYSEQDKLGRCGVAYANICDELMPTEPRGEIGMVKPSGWRISKYDFVDGKFLYNRCHLIGYQLAGENANEKNLITGTRYLNVVGMMPIENKIADYVMYTHNHVLYRVTPMYVDDELVARGVMIEAYSVEDAGKGICLNVYVFNVQPGVVIDYATGENHLDEEYDFSNNKADKNTDYNQNGLLRENENLDGEDSAKNIDGNNDIISETSKEEVEKEDKRAIRGFLILLLLFFPPGVLVYFLFRLLGVLK